MRLCEVEGCDRQHYAKGFCRTHYIRWSKSGDPGKADLRLDRLVVIKYCTVNGCSKPHKARGYCNAHYRRFLKNGLIGVIAGGKKEAIKVCGIEGCNRSYYCKGYCQMHYDRVKKYGDPGPVETYHSNTTRTETVRMCKIEGCGRKRNAHGLCTMHERRLKNTGTTDDPIKITVCQVKDCNEKHNAKGYCRAHYIVFFRYGITPEEYQRLLVNQDFCCKLCKERLDFNNSKMIHIDHCHKTNVVRGILCSQCNTNLGAFESLCDSVGLDSIVKYIKLQGVI